MDSRLPGKIEFCTSEPRLHHPTKGRAATRRTGLRRSAGNAPPDAKLPGQELQTLLNPRFAVIEVLARDHILAAQQRPAAPRAGLSDKC